MMGDGAAVEPKAAEIKAPVDGEVTFVFPSKHAIGFQTETGVSLLIHVGIDTVKLNGKGFESLVKVGDRVGKGTPLMRLDLEYLRENALSTITPVICTELFEEQEIEVTNAENVDAGDKLFSVCQYD